MGSCAMDQDLESIDIADFLARWPEVVEALAGGTTPGIDVIRDGRVVALVRPPRPTLHGYLRDSVQLPDGVDLTAPAFEGEPHAEHGRVHE